MTLPTVTFKFSVGDTVYAHHPRDYEEVCSGAIFKSWKVTEVCCVRGLNYCGVGGRLVEESFLLSEVEYADVAAALKDERDDCLQRKIDDMQG